MKYCKHCGKEITEEMKFCKDCGANTTTSLQPTQNEEEHPKFSKKKKMIISIAGSAVLLLVVVFSILNYLSSPDRLMKTLYTAIEEHDYEKINDLIYFSNSDDKIGVDNATSLATEIERTGSLEYTLRQLREQVGRTSTENYDLHLTPRKCFLLIDCYRIVTDPHYVKVTTNLNNVEIHRGNTTTTIENRDDEVLIGPLTYAEVTLQGLYENEFVTLEVEEVLEPLYTESVHLYFNYDSIWIEDIGLSKDWNVLLNDTEIDESMYLTSDSIGPIDANTDYTIEVIGDFPWGSLTTGKQPLSNFHDVYFQLPDDVLADIIETISDFYKQYLEVFRTNDPKQADSLWSSKEEVTELVEWVASLYDNVENNEITYYLDFKEFAVGNNHVKVLEDNKLRISTMINKAFDYHWYAEEIENPIYETDYEFFDLSYDDGKWSVDYYDSYYHDFDWDFGSELYSIESDPVIIKDSKTNKKSSSSDEPSDEIEETVLSYIDSLVDAINYNNYSEVAPYILDNSPLEDMQIGLINRLTENGTTEEVIDREVVSIEESGNNWLVKTNETIKIIYKSGKEEVSDYTWTYTVEKVEGNYYVSNIE